MAYRVKTIENSIEISINSYDSSSYTFSENSDTNFSVEGSKSGWYPIATTIRFGHSSAINLNNEGITYESGHCKLTGFGRSIFGTWSNIKISMAVTWIHRA